MLQVSVILTVTSIKLNILKTLYFQSMLRNYYHVQRSRRVCNSPVVRFVLLKLYHKLFTNIWYISKFKVPKALSLIPCYAQNFLVLELAFKYISLWVLLPEYFYFYLDLPMYLILILLMRGYSLKPSISYLQYYITLIFLSWHSTRILFSSASDVRINCRLLLETSWSLTICTGYNGVLVLVKENENRLQRIEQHLKLKKLECTVGLEIKKKENKSNQGNRGYRVIKRV